MFVALHADPQSIQGVLYIFLALAIGHAVADFPLQGSFLAKAKNRHSDISHYLGEGASSKIWLHAMTAHSLIHAGAVWLITGSFALAMIELVAHWFIDYIKCEGWIGFNTDQFLHYLCKIIYAMLLYFGMS